MNTLQAEQHRLYGADPSTETDAINLLSRDGRVRAMVMELARPADWNALGTVWRGVQTDLELPSPAIAVNGVDGYQLWFSLADPVVWDDARIFLEALRQRYLAAVPIGRIGMWPAVDGSTPQGARHAKLVPEVQPLTGHWSAFVAPDLASIFADEPWLDMIPGTDAQAGVLSGIECIKQLDFQRVLRGMQAVVKSDAPVATRVAVAASACQDLQPRRFLLDVMNDSNVEMRLRIEAAKALLPYCKD